jgi:hypothetical protein
MLPFPTHYNSTTFAWNIAMVIPNEFIPTFERYFFSMKSFVATTKSGSHLKKYIKVSSILLQVELISQGGLLTQHDELKAMGIYDHPSFHHCFQLG